MAFTEPLREAMTGTAELQRAYADYFSASARSGILPPRRCPRQIVEDETVMLTAPRADLLPSPQHEPGSVAGIRP